MTLLVYTSFVSSRLEYVLSVLFGELGLTDWTVTANADVFETFDGAKICYSTEPAERTTFRIVPVQLLYEEDVKEQSLQCFTVNNSIAFFETPGDFPFDIFAASFYLLSRYEEYLPYTPDSYGRYAHENSLAFKKGFLKQPLINIWLADFSRRLQERFPALQFTFPSFSHIPTYDIDMAWSYRRKGALRNTAGLLKSVVSGQWSSAGDRLSVVAGRKSDPFDIFGWLDILHRKYKAEPYYFFLLAQRNKQYDKNISPSDVEFRQLVQTLASHYKTGIHPSWQSRDKISLLSEEIDILKRITGKTVENSRQHYIRMTMPETYRQLENAGIKNDFSMGYGSINGFRASYCRPYLWFDLLRGKVTNLTLYPFCFMDANSYFEQHFTLQQAAEELEHYFSITKQVNGTLVTIWHNHLLGNKQLFKGWKEMYETFLARSFQK